jgi:hypothetical protein
MVFDQVEEVVVQGVKAGVEVVVVVMGSLSQGSCPTP